MATRTQVTYRKSNILIPVVFGVETELAHDHRIATACEKPQDKWLRKSRKVQAEKSLDLILKANFSLPG